VKNYNAVDHRKCSEGGAKYPDSGDS